MSLTSQRLSLPFAGISDSSGHKSQAGFETNLWSVSVPLLRNLNFCFKLSYQEVDFQSFHQLHFERMTTFFHEWNNT